MPIPASTILPMLDELKTELNITNAVQDIELQDKLDAAVAHLRSLGVEIDSEVVTETHRATSGSALILRRHPVLSVESVTHADGTVYASSDYDLDGVSGLLHLAYAGSYLRWLGTVTVSYTVGRAVLPADLREAVLLVAARLWETQRGNAPGARRPDLDEFAPDPGGLPVLSPRAETLLRPYLPGPVIA